LPFGTRVRILPKWLKPRSDKDGVVVRINDRGPFIPGRIIDLSTAAFDLIMPLGQGLGQVCLYRDL
jgi:rare lipoprotein A